MEGAPRFNKISPESEEYVSKREESKSYWTHWDVFGRRAMSALRSCRASLAGPARQPLERIAKIIEESKEDFITRLQSEKTAFYVRSRHAPKAIRSALWKWSKVAGFNLYNLESALRDQGGDIASHVTAFKCPLKN